MGHADHEALLEHCPARTYMPGTTGSVMLQKLNQLIRRMPSEAPSLPRGERVYAIGDIHGRLDLLVQLAWAIERDDAERSVAAGRKADTTIVFLGDLVDRGPDSAMVLRAARDWGRRRRVRLITGNHEEMFLKSFDKLETLSHFLRIGGFETIVSFGVDPSALRAAELEDAQRLMVEAVPDEDIAFVESFEDMVIIGDYVFVHAGLQPGKALGQQHIQNTRWIREPFLSNGRWHGHMVVHGHTITDEPALRHNRIGLDTGAYMSGKLTALGLEGTARWLIEASDSDGSIVVSTREI